MATTRLALDDLYALRAASDPQMDPDGTQVAYVVTAVDREADGYRSAIWLAPTGEGEPRQLTRGRADTCPRWSPDGTALAYLSAGEDGPPQLCVLPMGGGEAEVLTDLPGGAGPPVWSPDATALAFAGMTDIGPGDANRPVVLDRLAFKADGTGMLHGRQRHLFTVPRGGGPARQLTFGDFSVSDPVWASDGGRLAFGTARAEDRDLRFSSVVHVVGVDGGRPRALTPADGSLVPYAWHPDGGRLLLAGQQAFSPGHNRLYTVGTDGAGLTELAPGLDRNVMVGNPAYPGAVPRYVGGDVLFCVRERGRVHVLRLSGDRTDTVIGGDRVVAGMSVAAGRIAFLAADAGSNGEIHVADLADPSGERRLTSLFTDALPEVGLFAPVARTFTAPDGTPIEGWVVRDPDVNGATPLLLDIHGGPHNAWGPAFDGMHLYHQTLAAAGWTVLYVNPRGSDGYGEEFWLGVVQGWGRNDEADFGCAVDAMVADGLADPARLAVTGYSYGGFMTCWLTSHGTRFAAAVTGGCVADLVSMTGTSDMGLLLAHDEIGGDPFADPDRFAAHSPIAHVGNVRTPTLVLHGEADDRCPVSQGEQWFTALRTQGVPTQFVRYPGGSHLFILNGRPSHRVDYNRRVADWVIRHTTPGAPPYRRPLAARMAGFQARLDDLARRHDVPGAALAVLDGDEIAELTTGVTNVDTGEPVAPETLFQIGSITKVFTATMLMRLVDQGAVGLDDPVTTHVPELRLKDVDALAALRVRHLLTHSGGFDGDYFRPDLGWAPDTLAKYVEGMAELGQVHEVGELFSYCNSGFVLLGRLIEKVTGEPYETVLRREVLDPLGMHASYMGMDEILAHSAAIGHQPDGVRGSRPASLFWTHGTAVPAGGLCMSARELLSFARMHINGGGPVLTPASTALMRQRHMDLPVALPSRAGCGLAWGLTTAGDQALVGHNGGTPGQIAGLRVAPDLGLAIATLTNGYGGERLIRELERDLFAELAGLDVPEPPAPFDGPVDLAPFEGRYAGWKATMDVTAVDGGLTVEAAIHVLHEPVIETINLVPTDADGTLFRIRGSEATMGFACRDGNGRPRYFFSGRAYRRQD